MPDTTDRKRRAFDKVREATGVNLFAADETAVWDAVAHELAEEIRSHSRATAIDSDFMAAADLIDPERSR